jgi:hypothetical protein
MYIAAIVVIVAAGVVVLFFRLGYMTKRRHEGFEKHDVISALENVLSESSLSHDEFDLFLRWPIADPYLESIRQRCLDLVKGDPDEGEKDLGSATAESIRSLLAQLRGA